MKQAFFAIFIFFLLAACAPAATPAPTAEPTASSTLTPALTQTLTPQSTETLTPTGSPTLTAIPTLPVEAARARLLELLANNGGCRLPCVWGITPGKSTYQEAQAILAPLNSISILTGFRAEGGSIAPWYIENDLILSATVGFNVDSFSDNQIVNRVGFHAREFKNLADNRSLVYDSKIFGERLRPYMLPGILSEFGKPASVVIQTSGKQITGSGGFEILLFYPDQGIFVHYTTQMETVGVNARGCPANAQVELELYPSGNADAFAKSLAETDWAFAWPNLVENPSWKSIEDATSMTLGQFYETFHNPTDKCIETPAKLWPTPEPGGG